MSTDRKQTILETLSEELDRQAPGRNGGPIDLAVLAEAIDHALDSERNESHHADSGATPDELNSSNDG